MLGPGRVGQVGWEQDRFPGRDPGALAVDAHPATTLDDDEPARVRVGVRLEPPSASEGKLRDGATCITVDDRTTDTGRPRRTIGTPVAAPETADLDGHRRRLRGRAWTGCSA